MRNLAIDLTSAYEEFQPHANQPWSAVHPYFDCPALSQAEALPLLKFDAHGLENLDNAVLMNRVDSKYVVPRKLLGDLLSFLQNHYSVLQINGTRSFQYENTYYDTPTYSHYLAHHNGRLNRFKIRQRTYTDSHTSFLEVKFKNNRQRTIKSRIELGTTALSGCSSHGSFLGECGIQDHQSLGPVQSGSYRRIALADEARGERLTVDCDLTFNDLTAQRHFSVGPWIVVEVKQSAWNRNSVFFSWALERGVRSNTFSKYCMGVYFTGPTQLKRNNFHQTARLLTNDKLDRTHDRLQTYSF